MEGPENWASVRTPSLALQPNSLSSLYSHGSSESSCVCDLGPSQSRAVRPTRDESRRRVSVARR